MKVSFIRKRRFSFREKTGTPSSAPGGGLRHCAETRVSDTQMLSCFIFASKGLLDPLSESADRAKRVVIVVEIYHMRRARLRPPCPRDFQENLLTVGGVGGQPCLYSTGQWAAGALDHQGELSQQPNGDAVKSSPPISGHDCGAWPGRPRPNSGHP